MATLVEELKAIEKVPDSAGVDKSSGYRNLLRQWYEKSDLVRRFVSGQTSPSKETDKLAKRLGGWRAFVPVYFREENKQQIRELEPIVEGVHRDFSSRFLYLITNPVGMASLLSLGYAVAFPSIDYFLQTLYSVTPEASSYLIPREAAALAGAVNGAVIGTMASILKLVDINSIRNNGRYLESRIKEVGRV